MKHSYGAAEEALMQRPASHMCSQLKHKHNIKTFHGSFPMALMRDQKPEFSIAGIKKKKKMIEIDFLVLSGLRINDTNVWGIKSSLDEAKCGHPFEGVSQV